MGKILKRHFIKEDIQMPINERECAPLPQWSGKSKLNHNEIPSHTHQMDRNKQVRQCRMSLRVWATRNSHTGLRECTLFQPLLKQQHFLVRFRLYIPGNCFALASFALEKHVPLGTNRKFQNLQSSTHKYPKCPSAYTGQINKLWCKL